MESSEVWAISSVSIVTTIISMSVTMAVARGVVSVSASVAAISVSTISVVSVGAWNSIVAGGASSSSDVLGYVVDVLLALSIFVWGENSVLNVFEGTLVVSAGSSVGNASQKNNSDLHDLSVVVAYEESLTTVPMSPALIPLL